MPNQGPSTPITIRPTQDFQALPALGRPGGEKEGKASSTDIQFFEDLATQAQWIGKCGLSAMTKPHVLEQTQKHYEEKYKRNRYFDEYREAIGLALYQALGIRTPDVALSLQLPAKVSAADKKSLGDMLEYHQPSLHLMTKFVSGFQVLGKPFITAYQQTPDKSKPTLISTADGAELPLTGLGAALAMGCFLHDADCLGGGGANMGYVMATDEEGEKYAQLVKIDAGTAFSFLEGDAGIYAHDPRKRDMFFGLQPEFILRYEQLNAFDQAEFAATARRILQVPRARFKAIIDQGIAKDGFTPKQVERILNELLSRKSTFLNGFAPEVSAQLKAEVKAARQAVLAELAGPEEAKDEIGPDIHVALAEQAGQEKQAIEQAALLEKERIHGAPEEKFETRVFQQPSVNQHFTGRVEALETITRALNAQQGSVITQGITGLGGVGKTQLAAKYVQIASEESRYQNIIWFNAEYSIDVQFIMLAEAWYKLSGLQAAEAIERVYKRL